MDSPSNSITGFTLEFTEISTNGITPSGPIIIDLTDNTVLVDDITPTHVNGMVLDLQTGNLPQLSDSQHLTIFCGPNYKQQVVDCQNIFNLSKLNLEKHIRTSGSNNVLVETIFPCLRHLYRVSAYEQIQINLLRDDHSRLRARQNLICNQLDTVVDQINTSVGNAKNNIQTIISQVKININDIKLVIDEVQLHQTNFDNINT